MLGGMLNIPYHPTEKFSSPSLNHSNILENVRTLLNYYGIVHKIHITEPATIRVQRLFIQKHTNMNPLVIIFAIIILLGGGYFISQKSEVNAPNETQLENATNNDGTSATNLRGQTLDLSNKGLTKTPSYVFNMTNLVGLNLSNNMLDGALQAEVRHLQNLKVLDLSNNKFTGVPAEIGQLKNLEILNLSNNNLTGLPYELGNLSKLKLLDISGNNYSEADLSTIKKGLPASTVIKTK